MVHRFLIQRARQWPRLLEALFHQHHHDRVVERAIAFVFGERYRVIVRDCRCGHRVQTIFFTEAWTSRRS
jgi:hypothetical protein